MFALNFFLPTVRCPLPTVRRPLPAFHGDHGRGVGPGHARQQHAHQADHKFRVARRSRYHVRQTAEDLDAVVRIAELHLSQILGAERLLLHRLRGVGRYIHPLIGQRERGLPDHKMIARLHAEPLHFLAHQKNGIPRIRQARDLQARTVP